MPSRNSIKQFQSDAVYHVYNRGVGKAPVFLDVQDYKAFIRRLELALLSVEESDKLQHSKYRIRLANYSDRVQLQAFCLMPNHFHLMLWHADEKAITQFMHTLSTSYSMYFNRKYERVGPLFQGRFKAAWVDSDAYLIHLSRYIHCNPMAMKEDIYKYPYSSLQYYFERFSPGWLHPDVVEAQFNNKGEYHQFVNDLRDFDAAEANHTLD